MDRYAALLRAINVGGKNKVPMAELRQCFESLGFTDVKTVLNSGNVIFSAGEGGPAALTERIEAALRERFCFDIPAFVISRDALSDILRCAPDWWGSGDKAIYDELIFLMPPTTLRDVHEALGKPKDGLERVMDGGQAIFWSFDRKNYQKTNWWPKTAGTAIGARLTIRTANTVRTIADM